jgi:hypothetical protein
MEPLHLVELVRPDYPHCTVRGVVVAAHAGGRPTPHFEEIA